MNFVCLFLARQPPVGQGLLIHDISSSHTMHHSRYFSGRVISLSQRPLPDSTQQSQQTNIHAPGGIRTHTLRRQEAADLRVRPRGHWDWQCTHHYDPKIMTGFRHRSQILRLHGAARFRGPKRRGWFYFRFCVKHVLYVNSYTAISALPVQDFIILILYWDQKYLKTAAPKNVELHLHKSPSINP